MNTLKHSITPRHFLITLALASASTLGYAATPASTDLADVPIPTVSSTAVKPNIMFILDNSGSMEWTFMPDSVNGNSSSNCFKNYKYNGVYYDPNTTYLPPVDYLGNSYVNSTWPTAKLDGFGAITTNSCNLSTSFSTTATTSCGSTAAYYYKYTGATPVTPVKGVCYANSSYTKVTVSSTSGPGNTDERVNFANWFSYYRTRLNTMKTAMGRTFSGIGANYRIGLSSIDDNNNNSNNNIGDNFLNIADFDSSAGAASQKYKWYQKLYATPPSGGTPLQKALSRAGEYFRTGNMGYSGGPAMVDPVQYSCQQNFSILSTDGYWNNNTVTLGNTDKTVPALPAPVTGLTTGNQWPRPFYEGPTTTSNTLADVAMYYWVTDLRPSGSWAAGIAANNVTTSSGDPAIWQHMTTFTIGLAPGKLTYPTDLAYITAGSDPNLTDGVDASNWPNPIANTGAERIDDLWHAAVNGHGQHYEASDTSTIVSGLSSILNNIAAITSTSAAATLNSIVITGGNNLAYTSTYDTGNWTGELEAFTINTANGAFSATPLWPSSARTQLDTRSTDNSDSRLIASFNPTTSAGIPFQWGNLNATQQTQLNSTISLLQYLRGWRCNEISNTCGSGTYRQRTHLLGDIVNSEGAYVGPPSFTYADGGYASFKAGLNARPQTVLVGANDGMLHAFDGSTTGGAERWAYVPNLVMSTIKNLANPPVSFQHKFYVDGTPVAGDVDFNQDWNITGLTATPDWRTIVVGGLNHGGKGFYAIDATNPVPAPATEATLASKVLWEFPNASNPTHAGIVSNVGFSYGNPVITKVTNPQGSPAWVVMVTSGYHNGTVSASCADCSGGDGKGYLYVLDVQTGDLLYSFATNSGSGVSPSGLAKVAAYIDDFASNNTIMRAYAGDLDGNLWRFNFSGTPSSWTVQKWATLKDPTSVVQPITVLPTLADINGKHMVYVGTGRYIGQPDVSNTQVQSMWALKDDLSGVALGDVRSQVNTTTTGIMQLTLAQPNATTITSTSSPTADLNTNKGWVVDFNLPAHAGERPTDPVYLFGTLVFTTNIPSTNVCDAGGSSWLYYLDGSNGGNSPFQSGAQAATFIGNVISTRVVPFTLNSTPYVTFRTSKPTTTFSPPTPVCPAGTTCPAQPNPPCTGSNCSSQTPPKLPSSSVNRVHWREILN